MEERERDGITIDICRDCRGIWLDRGELERLISKANQDMEGHEDTQGRQAFRDEHYDKSYESHHQKHNSHDHHGHGDSHHQRRKHWLAELFD
jgi:uncharacterized protein